MSRTIYKYSLSETHQIPHSAKLIHAGRDPAGELCAWYDLDTSNSPETVSFELVGTGHEVPRGASHVVTIYDGPFVWHFYSVAGHSAKSKGVRHD